MLKQIKQLLKIQICNLFGINEVRYTKDPKKKIGFVGMAFIWSILIIMFIAYMTVLSTAYIKMGMGEIIPSYLYVSVSIIILIFSFLKASSVIFQMNTYEMMISLPVSKSAIVISRFLTMYISNLFLSIIIMVPAMIVYAINMQPSISFYILYILGIVVLPMIPITLSTAIGAAITAISSRMKHKNIINAVLTLVFCLGVMVVSSSFGSMESLTEQTVKNIAELMTEAISKVYPPAIWFGEAAVKGDFISFIILIGVSILIFSCLVFVLQKYFMKICIALNATTAKNNYKMQSLKSSSVLVALWKKEIKQYFSISVYVVNTIIGYILMTVTTIGLCVVGIEKVEEIMQLHNVIRVFLPFVIAIMAIIMPTTSCSISIEGKQWWMAKTLPLSSKNIFDSKILLNLTIAAPFYIISVLFPIIAIRPSIMEAIWLVVIPAIYILFAANIGIAINIAFPKFEWDNEVKVVKQGAAVLITMLVNFVGIAIPGISIYVLGNEMINLVMFLTSIILLIITAIIYVRNCKVKISSIE